MKNAWIILTVLSLFSIDLFAQKRATWAGGTPGQPSNWFCPSNWKEHRVPNEFSSVLIPDVSTSTFHYPVIDAGTVEIGSLECATKACVTLANNARLLINSEPAHKKENIAFQNLMCIKTP